MQNLEEALLCCLIQDNSVLLEIENEIEPTDFVNLELAGIYELIKKIIQEESTRVDVITLVSRLNRADGQLMVMEWFARTPFAVENAKWYAQEIRRESIFRQGMIAAEKIKAKALAKDDGFLEEMKNSFDTIEGKIPCEIENHQACLGRVLQEMEECALREDSFAGTATGYSSLDQCIFGFEKGELILLAARPSMGKSTLALNIADNMMLAKKEPVLFISLEMSKVSLIKRSIVRFTEIPSQLLFNGKLDTDHWDMMANYMQLMRESKLVIIDKPNLSLQAIRSYCRKVQKLYGLGGVIIDYIGLVNCDGENETHRIGVISAGLKAIAKDFNIFVLALSQLNRNIELRQDKKPMLSDLRQSGSLEQDADKILFIDKHETYGFSNIHVSKNRNGRTGVIPLRVNPELFEFKDIHE